MTEMTSFTRRICKLCEKKKISKKGTVISAVFFCPADTNRTAGIEIMELAFSAVTFVDIWGTKPHLL